MAIPQVNDPFSILLNNADKLLPEIFGTGTKTEQSQVDPTASANSNELFNTLMSRGSSTSQADAVIQDIIYRTQAAFASVLGEQKAAGGYNSTTAKLLADNAAAQAVKASAQAVFEDQQKALAAATQLSGHQINANKTITTKATPLPWWKAAAPTLATMAYSKFKKAAGTNTPDAQTEGQAANEQVAATADNSLSTSGSVAQADQESINNALSASPVVGVDTTAAAEPIVQSSDQAVQAALDNPDLVSTLGDVGAPVTTVGSDILSNVDQFTPDAAGGTVQELSDEGGSALSDFFDSFFADGGLVRGDMAKVSVSKNLAGRKFKKGKLLAKKPGYKDGGLVKGYAAGGAVSADDANAVDLNKKRVRYIPGTDIPDSDLDAYAALNSMFASSGAGGTFGNAVNAVSGGAGDSFGSAALQQAIKQSLDAASAAEGGTGPASTSAPDYGGNDSPFAGLVGAVVGAFTNAVTDVQVATETNNAVATEGEDIGSTIGVPDMSPVPAPDPAPDPAAGDPSTGDPGDGSASAAPSSGASSSDGGDGSGAGWKAGGDVEGPGTGTSDSIPAFLSTGEYVIPADVVQQVGTKFFDDLIEEHHTPVKKAAGGRK